MQLGEISGKTDAKVISILAASGINELRPAQEKALNAGLLEGRSLLICTPTASGKTLIAELAAARTILSLSKKALYIVPLVALAREKYRDFLSKYKGIFSISVSTGEAESTGTWLGSKDMIICTAEKLDSIIRHDRGWLSSVGLVVVDEIHLLNDASRGPTLEILITLLKQLIPDVQLLGLSATIGNPEELASWLGAALVQDSWRPVPLRKGVMLNHSIEFLPPDL